jgi:general secretion pathway protein G
MIRRHLYEARDRASWPRPTGNSLVRTHMGSRDMRDARSISRRWRHPARSAGFTLIEIMVVVVIIGLLAAMIVPNVVGHVEQARLTRARQDIQALSTALTMYRIDNFRYPTTDQGLKALVERPADPTIKNWRDGGYVQQGSLKDPWGNDYQYVYPGTHGHEYDLYSLGPNGEEGSTDSGTVIGNWNPDGNAGSSGTGGGATGGAP